VPPVVDADFLIGRLPVTSFGYWDDGPVIVLSNVDDDF
jgi:hypothetical protein